MYKFKITELPDGGYRFELGAIKMLIDKFNVTNNRHELVNPEKAIGFFNVDGNIYGIANDVSNGNSVEALYDNMSMQYLIFTNTGKSNNLQQTA